MSFLVAYEVQTFESGAWKIASMFNEKELALIEARRLEQGIRRRETRVVEESHDEESGRTRTKIVYTTPPLRSDLAPAHPQAAEPAKAPAKKAPPAKGQQGRPRPPRQVAAAGAAGSSSYVMITVSFILIVALGVGGLIGLRYLAQLG